MPGEIFACVVRLGLPDELDRVLTALYPPFFLAIVKRLDRVLGVPFRAVAALVLFVLQRKRMEKNK